MAESYTKLVNQSETEPTDENDEDFDNRPAVIGLDQLPPNMSFHPASPPAHAHAHPHSSHQLILLFGWMLARTAHMRKYTAFWNARGYDILVIQTSVFDFLYPPLSTTRNFRGITGFWDRNHTRYHRVLIHSFSAGGYASIDFLSKVRAEAEQTGTLESNAESSESATKLLGSLRGLIMDSLTFVCEAPIGIAQSLSANPVMQALIRATVTVYLQLTRPLVLGYCGQVEAALYENPWRLPGLFLFSRDDPIALSDTTFRLMDVWRDSGVPVVRGKCWDASPHVGHYRRYPAEYEWEVEQFLESIQEPEYVPEVFGGDSGRFLEVSESAKERFGGIRDDSAY